MDGKTLAATAIFSPSISDVSYMAGNVVCNNDRLIRSFYGYPDGQKLDGTEFKAYKLELTDSEVIDFKGCHLESFRINAFGTTVSFSQPEALAKVKGLL